MLEVGREPGYLLCHVQTVHERHDLLEEAGLLDFAAVQGGELLIDALVQGFRAILFDDRRAFPDEFCPLFHAQYPGHEVP